MSRNRLGTRRALRFTQSGSSLLPWVGPFQVLSRPNSKDLPSLSYGSSTQISGAGTADNNPLLANNLTINTNTILTSATYGMFMWANVITMKNGSRIVTDGEQGGDGFPGGCCETGFTGSGGNGSSGGGGGSANEVPGCSIYPGGSGGDGNNGGPGVADCSIAPGSGGTGSGRASISRYPSLVYGTFTYDIGGTSGCTASTGPWGSGGWGGGTNCGLPPNNQPGGGGGAGPQVIVCNNLIGVPAFGAGVQSIGGVPGSIIGCGPVNNAQYGGSGNIYIFTKKYIGNTIGAFGFNTVIMYEVDHDGVTILNSFTNDTGHTWNHL